MRHRMNIEDIKKDLTSDNPTKTLDEWVDYVMYYANDPALEYQFAMQIPSNHRTRIINHLSANGYIKYNDSSHDVPLFNDRKINRYVRGYHTSYDTSGRLYVDSEVEVSKIRQGRGR